LNQTAPEIAADNMQAHLFSSSVLGNPIMPELKNNHHVTLCDKKTFLVCVGVLSQECSDEQHNQVFSYS